MFQFSFLTFHYPPQAKKRNRELNAASRGVFHGGSITDRMKKRDSIPGQIIKDKNDKKYLNR